MSETPVVICGAGPTGLALGLELARFGVPFRIVDRSSEATQHSGAIGVQARTLELLEPACVTDTLLAAGQRVTHAEISSNEHVLFNVSFDGMPTAYSWLTLIPQNETERIFGARLSELGVEIERNVTLGGTRATPDGVEVTLTHASGMSERVRARYLAACDGAHSTIRHDLAIGFAGHALTEHFSLADVRLETALSTDTVRVALGRDGGLIVLFPLPGRWRVILESRRDDLPGAVSLADVQAALDHEHVPARVTEMLWVSIFHINQRRLEAMQAGPIFFLGDAAHIHSPIGGQGMNTGIGDAVNLAWKLALVIRDGVPEPLLDTFGIEREAVARALLAATDYGNRIVLSANTMVRALRNAVVPVASHIELVRSRLRENVAQLRIAYPTSPLSVNGSPARRGLRAGMRVRGARPSGYRPQTMMLHPNDSTAAMTIVVRPDGYAGYVSDGAHARGARTYLHNVIGLPS